MELPPKFYYKVTFILIISSLLVTFKFLHHTRFYETKPRSVKVLNSTNEVDKFNLLDCTKSSQKFIVFPSGHYCLRLMTERQCYDGLPVPNLVHYIMFNTKQIYFYNLLSILSSYRILHPCFIYIHGNLIPTGKWWNHLLELVPNIVFVKTEPPIEVFQNKVNVIQHKSDIIRLRVMLEYGGIYMDTDQIALKSFDPLRKYQLTLSKSNTQSVGNAVIIADKRAPFLRLWYLTYTTFNDKQWGFHSCLLPYKLAQIVPKLVHLESYNFFGFEKSIFHIFKEVCDWSHRYGLHLYYTLQKRKGVKDFNPQAIKKMDTTFGEVARYIYYGQLPKKRKKKC